MFELLKLKHQYMHVIKIKGNTTVIFINSHVLIEVVIYVEKACVEL